METPDFNQLLLKTAFCCMACDGNVDEREINLIRTHFSTEQSETIPDLQKEINCLIVLYNENGESFIKSYFDILGSASLSDKQQLMVIECALKTILADDEIKYSEIKFFRAIRSKLNISNETILNSFPEIESFLEEDISTISLVDKMLNQYLDIANLPQIKFVNFDELKENNSIR